MTTYWNVNQTPTTGPEAMFQLVKTMLSGGYTQLGSGDTSTWATGSAGPISTSAGLAGNGSWIRLRMPSLTFGGTAAQREFCIQRSNADADWWIRYSVSGNFSGGSPSATVAPTATDQVNLYGTSQASAAGFFSTNGLYRCNCMCYDASGSYGFYLFTFYVGGGGASPSQTGFVFDPLTQASSMDKDPYILYTAGASGQLNNGFSSTHFGAVGAPMLAFMSTSLVSANCMTVMASVYTNGITGLIVPATLGVDPFGLSDHTWPIHYGRRANYSDPNYLFPNGPKGWGTIMKYPGVQRSTGDALSISAPGARDYINVRQIVLPWNGSDPLV